MFDAFPVNIGYLDHVPILKAFCVSFDFEMGSNLSGRGDKDVHIITARERIEL
jgi:hypothetical protein